MQQNHRHSDTSLKVIDTFVDSHLTSYLHVGRTIRDPFDPEDPESPDVLSKLAELYLFINNTLPKNDICTWTFETSVIEFSAVLSMSSVFAVE